jgi:hypothetical protein
VGRVTKGRLRPAAARPRVDRPVGRGGPAAVTPRPYLGPERVRTTTDDVRSRRATIVAARPGTVVRPGRATAGLPGGRRRERIEAPNAGPPPVIATAPASRARVRQVTPAVAVEILVGAAAPTGPIGIAPRRGAVIRARRPAALASAARPAALAPVVTRAARREVSETGRHQRATTDPVRRGAPDRDRPRGRPTRVAAPPAAVIEAGRATGLPPEAGTRAGPVGSSRPPAATTTGPRPRVTRAAPATDRRRRAGIRAAPAIGLRPVPAIGSPPTGAPRRPAGPNGAVDPAASATDRASARRPVPASSTTKAAPTRTRWPSRQGRTTPDRQRAQPATFHPVATGAATIPSGVGTPTFSAGG